MVRRSFPWKSEKLKYFHFILFFLFAGRPTFTTTPKPATLVYQATMKFIELGDRYQLPVRGTKEYTDLQVRISNSLREQTKLMEVPGFTEVAVTKFRSTRYVF